MKTSYKMLLMNNRIIKQNRAIRFKMRLRLALKQLKIFKNFQKQRVTKYLYNNKSKIRKKQMKKLMNKSAIIQQKKIRLNLKVMLSLRNNFKRKLKSKLFKNYYRRSLAKL